MTAVEPRSMREHGTYVRYVQGPNELDVSGSGCRCEPCRAANREYERRRTQRIEPPYVSAGPAREHLRWLSSNGIGLKSVAKATGVSTGCLSKLIYGDSGRGSPPSRRIRPATASKILAVAPGQFANGSREPAAPVRDLVERLVAAGVPKARIAERLGQTGPGLQLGLNYVTRRHATVLRQMVAELDAGTLVTVKRTRHGARVIAPQKTEATPESIRAALDERDRLYAELAEIIESRNAAGWHADAACRGRPSWMFFPSRGDVAAIRAARKVCAACVVRGRCLAENLDQQEGIYAGTSPKQRRKIRAAKQAA